MINLFLFLALFVVSLIILIKSSEGIVNSSVKIAKYFHVSEFVIGLTIIAIGTSLPELTASIMASFGNHSTLIIGTILGSNISNICLILGIAGLIGVLIVKKSIFEREVQVMLIATVVFYLFALDQVITSFEAVILLIGFIYYLLIVFKFTPQFKYAFDFKHYLNFFTSLGKGRVLTRQPLNMAEKKDLAKQLLFFGLSLAFLLVSAKLLIDSAVEISSFFSISEGVIGLTLIALGTSLPELAVSIQAVRKKLSSMVVGNVIGSNIANLLLVGGITALIAPLHVSLIEIQYVLPLLVVISILFINFVWLDWKLQKRNAIVLLLAYFVFISLVILNTLAII
ncbi:MAG: calcium/sodium antiporter [archaeon]